MLMLSSLRKCLDDLVDWEILNVLPFTLPLTRKLQPPQLIDPLAQAIEIGHDAALLL
jgi:hypothetical protein